MLPTLRDLIDLQSSLTISRFVNIRLQSEIGIRLHFAIEYSERAQLLLAILLQENAIGTGDTFQTVLPKMSALAHAAVDHLHIAVNITTSLSKIEGDDIEYPSGNRLGGPYCLEQLNTALGRRVDSACTSLKESGRNIKMLRDTAHHIKERLNGKAKEKQIVGVQFIQIGNFVRDDALFIESTAANFDSADRTPTTVPGCVARVELSQHAFSHVAKRIGSVFATLPWDGPLPEIIRPQSQVLMSDD